ncbi:MAG: 30S ribosomal protein S9 [Verrucomicrobia bacterium]|jgi:small subunit ribosomal protein S9|nr:30S ribosomal protein S9 [Verrucomicrobiota bacterium]MDA1007202.1 30S ribosomal protein S9 [Verrucomicrobiota bacterium]
MAATQTVYSATGRRKTAVARVWLTEGTGSITINDRPFEEYFPNLPHQNEVLAPLQVSSLMNKYDIKIVAKGGGLLGQAGAIKLGVARAITQIDLELRGDLKAAGHLRRDPRMKERKKPGQPGARKRFQFSKR